MATIKVFSANGVKELHNFDTLLDVPFLDPLSEEAEIVDDGELTVGEPIEE